MTKSGVSLYALTNVFVSHMMRTKTSLQESYLHTNKLAYQKGKNRIMRVKNTANFVQKCEYFVCGLHLHTVSLMYKVVRYVPFRQIPSRLRSLLKGTLVGLFS